MSFQHGKDSEFYVDNSGGTLTTISVYVDNCDFPMTAETAETTTFTDADKTRIAGLKDGSCSISGSWDNTATTGPDAILSSIVGTEVTLAYFPAGCTSVGNATGSATKPGYTGQFICTDYSVSSPVGDKVSYSASWERTGAITRATGLVT